MKLVKDRLFNPSLNNFRGGGDAVGAALSNFINARENARARAVRNEELRRRDAQAGMRPNGNGQTPNAVGEGEQASWGSIFNMDNNGIDSMPQGYTEGTPIGANSTDYSFPFRQGKEPNDYTFQNAMPTEQNGFHLGSYPQTEMYGDPKDFQRQMVRNELYNGQKTQNVGDNTMNIRDQGIGQNYNQRINSQVDGFYPQSPNSNVNSFGSVFQNADKSNAITVNPNFQNPSSDNNSALTEEGQPVSGADNTTSKYDALMRGLANADYLDRQYTDYNTWSDWANQSGVDDEASRRVLYAERVQPLIEEARQERLRENYRISNDPDVDEQTRMQARAALAYDLKKPDLVNELQRREDEFYAKQGMIRNPNYSSNGGSSAGNNILSALGDYEEGEQWMSPDGTGTSRTQCSNWVSDVLRKAGIKGLGHANGDELMRQFGNAYHEGLDGIQPGDVLNFKDHVGIYAGNGQYVARNSSGGVHQGSMEEAIQYFGQPLGYGSVGEYTGTSRNQKYIKDPNAMTKDRLLGLRHKYNMEEIEARTNARTNARNRQNGTNRVNNMSDDDMEQAVYDFADSESPTFKQGHAIGNAWAQDFSDYVKEYESVEQAAKQMYYDYAAMNPQERGWSMSAEKLATAVGYAAAHAQGLGGTKASNVAKKVASYILNNQGEQTSPAKGNGEKTQNKGVIKPEVGKPNGNSNSSWSFSNMFGGIGNVAKKAKEGDSIGTSNVGDSIKGAISNFMSGVEKDRQERRNKQKDEERDRFNSLR